MDADVNLQNFSDDLVHCQTSQDDTLSLMPTVKGDLLRQ